MTPSKAFLLFCLSFVGGIFIASFFDVPKLIIYEFFVLAGFYLLLGTVPAQRGQSPAGSSFRKVVVIFAACLIFLGLGILRTEVAKPVELTETRSLSATEVGPLETLKQKLRETVYQNLSPPQSSILAAIVLGDKRRISPEWKEKLNRAGVRHITAISGMHIVILSQILIWLGLAIGLWRGQAFYFAIVLLWLFISFTGFQPSAIRAGIMGSLLLLAQKIGRQKSGGRLLVIAATAMLMLNPLLLRHSVGFQLSFLATLGIIYLMPFFQNGLEKIKLLKATGSSSLLSMTFAAQVFTLPILIYNFGYVSLVSPITNILIVPLLSYMMVGGFLFLLPGLFWQPLAWVLSWPAFLLLAYLTSVVSFFSQIPWASSTIENLHWLWLFLIYLILAYLTWRLNKRKRFAFLP